MSKEELENQKRRFGKPWGNRKLVVGVAVFAALMFGFVPSAYGMHIMEGHLPAKYCIVWGAICLPFLAMGFFSIKKKLGQDPKTITILAMSGAFIFVISSLKIPSVTGSCSHMTGTGLGAILFGPFAVSILGVIVLLFQSILLAHGGLTTLGANTFSMAVAGPFAAYGIYHLLRRTKWGGLSNKKISVFAAAMIGDLVTYCVTSLQLAQAYPDDLGGLGVSVVKFLGVFAPTQLPLAVIEGFLTVVIVIGLETYANQELVSIGFSKGVKSHE